MYQRSRTTCQRVVKYMPRIDGWGSVPIVCSQSVGLSTWRDDSGVERRACSVHLAALRRRYPPEMVESEMRMAAGDR